MIIDCHSHVLNESSYQEYISKCNADILLCVKFFKGYLGGVFDDRDQDLDHFADHHDDLYLVESIDFNTNILAQLDEIKNKLENTNKIKALKIYPGYQPFAPSHERLLPVYSFAAENKLPVILHSGALYGYKESQAMLQYTNPVLVDEAAVKFPETTFVLSGFGFPYLIETAMVLNKNNNVYADISGIIDDGCYEVFREDLRRALRYYGGIAPQILFGTGFIGDDTVQNETGLYVKLVEELFSPEEKELVFYKNSQRIFNL